MKSFIATILLSAIPLIAFSQTDAKRKMFYVNSICYGKNICYENIASAVEMCHNQITFLNPYQLQTEIEIRTKQHKAGAFTTQNGWAIIFAKQEILIYHKDYFYPIRFSIRKIVDFDQ